jgi:hypothetical protein
MVPPNNELSTGAKSNFEAVDILYPLDAERREYFASLVKESIKRVGFTKTLRQLERLTTKRPGATISEVYGGVLEVNDLGRVDAALETEHGRVVLVDGCRTNCPSISRQQQYSDDELPLEESVDSGLSPAQDLISELIESGNQVPVYLICEAEMAQFDDNQSQLVLPILWSYIEQHKTSKNQNELVAVASAIRKYIAIMPMSQIGELAMLLAPGNQEPLSLDLELEVAKMIYRNFEVFPPTAANLHPELSSRLWEMACAYTNPRILLRDKHSAVASLAIEAIVAMRSDLALEAWQMAMNCPFRWFGEMVSDDLRELRNRWESQGDSAFTWLDDLRKKVSKNS